MDMHLWQQAHGHCALNKKNIQQVQALSQWPPAALHF